jgi:glycosyltransferase involved in cell wall biosynthesis
VRVCLVGAEDRLFHAGWRPDDPFRVLFVGKLIPLHGLETILDAARLAPDVPIRIIGSGQLDRLMDDHPANVEWVRWITYEDLPPEYWGAGCALGIFGNSDKAQRVIPNKAYQALACGTPLITADTRGARELLAHGSNALLVPPGDPAALADAIQRLVGDPGLARRLSAAGRQIYEERASEDVLGRRWRSLIEELL